MIIPKNFTGWTLPQVGYLGLGFKIVLLDGYYYVNGVRIAAMRIKKLK